MMFKKLYAINICYFEPFAANVLLIIYIYQFQKIAIKYIE